MPRLTTKQKSLVTSQKSINGAQTNHLQQILKFDRDMFLVQKESSSARLL